MISVAVGAMKDALKTVVPSVRKEEREVKLPGPTSSGRCTVKREGHSSGIRGMSHRGNKDFTIGDRNFAYLLKYE